MGQGQVMKTGMNVHSFTEHLISIMMQSFKGVTKTTPEKTPTLKFYLTQETHQFPCVIQSIIILNSQINFALDHKIMRKYREIQLLVAAV